MVCGMKFVHNVNQEGLSAQCASLGLSVRADYRFPIAPIAQWQMSVILHPSLIGSRRCLMLCPFSVRVYT